MGAKTPQPKPTFGLSLGPLSPPISDQLAEQGLEAPESTVEGWQAWIEAWNRLRFAGGKYPVLTDSMSDDIARRIMKVISSSKDIKRIEVPE